MDERSAKTMLIIAIGIGAAVFGVALMLYRGTGGVGGRMSPGILWGVVIVILMVVFSLAAFRIACKRKKGGGTPDAAAIGDLGLDYVAKVPKGFHRHFGKLPGIPNGGDTAHVLTGELAGRPLTAFQHYYMTMAGQTPMPVYHAVYLTAAPLWPGTTIGRRGAIGWLLCRLGMKRGLILENESFNQSMKVRTDSEDFALTLLGPEMQEFLLEDRTVTWRIGDGYVSMILTGRMRFDDVRAMLYRLSRFWELVPQELEAW